MCTLLILADDLTGALDTGVQSAKKGISTRVILSPPEEEDRSPPAAQMLLPEEQVLVINTGSRHCSPDEAAALIGRCLSRYEDVPYVYKKTDSTMRGHIGAELGALLKNRREKMLPFIPAYPGLGRTTFGGRQFLDGLPVDKSSAAGDLLNPVGHAFIPRIIAEESELPVRLAAAESRGPAPGDEKHILVYDCGSDEELRRIAASLAEQGNLGISAGCAGFAGVLVDFIPFPPSRKEPGSGRPGGAGKAGDLPILIVSGSRHPVSVAQLGAALESGIRGIGIEGGKLLGGEWIAGAEARSIAAECAEILLRDRACVLGTALSLTGAETCGGEGGAGLAGRLGFLVKQIQDRTGPLLLAVFGGDTLLGLMEILGFEYLIPINEIESGVVFAEARGKGKTALMAAKSGAFGGPDIIQKTIGFFRAGNAE
jgi:uncharacterized protein YgbK (DUF1537 family)